MIFHVRVDGREFAVELGTDGVFVDGDPVAVDLAVADGSTVRSLIMDGRSYRASVRRNGRGTWRMDVGGRGIDVTVMTARERAIREMAGVVDGAPCGSMLRAPMPGLVLRVEVEPGARVEAGAGLVIVEAMKMENELVAPEAGVVRAVHVAAGDTVERDQVLIEIAPPERSQ